MAVELYVAESGKYLVSRITEEITVEIARDLAIKTERLAQETGVYSRLIDVRGTPNRSTIVNNYDFAYKVLDEVPVDRASKAAALVSPGDTSHDFIMIAIKNSGFNAKTFTDEAAAIAWLEGEA